MSIQLLDLFHGAVFSKIVRASSNKISIIEVSSEDGSYKLETENSRDREMFIKYSSNATPCSRGGLKWNFNSMKYNVESSFALVCIEGIKSDLSKQTMEICYLSPEKCKELFIEDEINAGAEISCVVSLNKGQSFRVKRSHKDIELVISKNAIEKV